LRILLLTQFFQPEPHAKGIPLAKRLRDLGHDVEVLTGFPNYPGGKLYPHYRIKLFQQEYIDGIKVIRVPLYPSHSRSAFRRIVNYLSFGLSVFLLGPWLVKRPDVIHVYNLITLAPAWRLLQIIFGSKIVLDVQDLWPESVTSSGMLRSHRSSRVLEIFCRIAYNGVNQIVVLSPGFKHNLMERGIAESKIHVIYNWCDEDYIKIPAPHQHDAFELGFTNRFNIVFAGTMGASQSLDCVLNAATMLEKELPDVLFTFVGGGTDLPRLRLLATGLSNVQFLEHRPMAEIGRVLANAEVLLVHLKDEPVFRITIPSKIQGYLYAGKPVLCGVRGDASELIHRSGCGLTFTPETTNSLVEAIRVLRSKNPEELKAMGNAGKQFYDSELSLAQGTKRLEKIFLECVEPSQSKSPARAS
jgi:colanic acid biosynthesis glycosyl transferase WcaI